MKYYKVNEDRVYVIYNAWQHMLDIVEDESYFDNHHDIQRGEYILAASGITPQKNFRWIIENSKHNPNIQYVIVGSIENCTQDDMENTDNVLYTGRVSDGELKALMHYCKAFIHPAIYEGFGLTPMEAIASGCKNIILSKASCLPEIYADCAHYIDPKNPDVNLEELLAEPCDNPETILDKFGWDKAARQLYDFLKILENE